MLFTFMMLQQYTQLFPVAIKIHSLTAARYCYDLQNILSSWTWVNSLISTWVNFSFSHKSFSDARQFHLFGAGSRAFLATTLKLQSKVLRVNDYRRPFHLHYQNAPGISELLFFTEYRALGKKTQKPKPHAPRENKTEHSMSHMVLSRGRMKEKRINYVWQMLMKHRDSF